MPLYDFSCPQGHVTESMETPGTKRIICPECGNRAKRIFSFGSKVNMANEDAKWIRDIVRDERGVSVVSRNSADPHVQAFRQNPTRTNYQAWMKGEGLRHVEPGEVVATKPPQFDLERHTHKTLEKLQEMRRLEVRTH